MAVINRLFCAVQIVCVLQLSSAHRLWMTTDELENHISPDDLREFMHMHDNTTSRPNIAGSGDPENLLDKTVPDIVDCFGLGSITRQLTTWLLNMRPDPSHKINTHFYFSSRQIPYRVQVMPGDQFGLEWVDFKPTRKTVIIVHGFMSHSNASWVHDMTRAFLQWADVNVIAVDWSEGGNTWKYWRAVANTRRVGSDVTNFLRQLKAASGCRFKDFHFVGHSLGAHICSFASYLLGGVERITGLDPAQPCFRTANRSERLDKIDADFVDVIHTNGRLLQKVGFGLPEPTGHADFYPNGGMKQPGCYNESRSDWLSSLPFSPIKLQQAICSHGRAYLLFTESLINSNCSFRAHRWNLTYESVNSSLVAACDRQASCSEMGINAVGGSGRLRAAGTYFVLTTDKEPYCPTEWERRHPQPDLLWDLLKGFRLDRFLRATTTEVAQTAAYADPLETDDDVTTTTTQKSWFRRWVG
ncbi:pancreatic triacylglycerol lipase-like isoform X1 [Ostrinia nubilalis]|uniref:pancreatic triacylglycerol lipase-like isoform X1 n=2 Tax=Ostrinia nubilalis TaxID=29057 RepID=UPI00308236F9